MAPTRPRKSGEDLPTATGEAPVKRGRGRPPKDGVAKQVKVPSGRPRGRPPGSTGKKKAATGGTADSKPAPTTKRAAANAAAAASTDTKIRAAKTPRATPKATGTGKRGRPRKNDASTPAKKATSKSAGTGKRGRPRKSDVPAPKANGAEDEDEDADANADADMGEGEEEEESENQDADAVDEGTDGPLGDAVAAANGDGNVFGPGGFNGDDFRVTGDVAPSYVPGIFSSAYKAYRRVSRRFTAAEG